MAKQTINIGAAPNDGTGTPLRTSFDYTNQNFTELYTALGGGVGLPGSTTQVIFNDGGTNLAGDAGLTYDKTTDALTVVGALSGSKLTVTGGTIPANGVYLPAANTLEFAANSLAQYRIAPLGVFSWYDGAGGTRMTLNSTGLGVGVVPASASKIHTLGTGANVYAIFQNGDALAAAKSSQLWLSNGSSFIGVNNRDYRIQNFATSSTAADLIFDYWNGTSVAERCRFDSNGNMLVGVTSANANGGVLQLKSGITFPATQVAATDVNTLDDYEEGTFTPTIVGSAVAGVGVYTSQDGKYTKIGNIVHCQIYLAWTAHTGTGGILFSLPFTAAAGSGFASGAIGTISNVALSAGYVAVAYVGDGQSLGHIDQYPSGGGASITVPMDAAGAILVSMTYRA